MKKVFLAVLLAALVGLAPRAMAQQKPKAEGGEKQTEVKKEITPVRVQVVFSEFEGEKKISSLPYTMLINAVEGGPTASLRVGLRVPVQTGSAPNAQIQYVDMGTNLDGKVEKTEDGRYLLHLGVERSSAYSSGSAQKPASAGGAEITSLQPVMQQFRTRMDLLFRDGQTIQSAVSTDPVTGHVLKVDVTLNVLK